MNALLPYLMIMIGFALLIKGADLFGGGCLGHRPAIQRFGHGDRLDGRGLRDVCPGTGRQPAGSVPKTTDIAIGNVIGSNIANILLILGIAGLIRPLQVTSETVWREIPMCLLAAVVLVVLANDRFIDGGALDILTRIDGLVLLSFFVIFMYYTVTGALKIRGLGEFVPAKTTGAGQAFVYIRLQAWPGCSVAVSSSLVVPLQFRANWVSAKR